MTTATTFHSIHPGTLTVCCDACGCVVPAGERERQAHADWHARAEEVVVELAHEEAVRVVELRAS